MNRSMASKGTGGLGLAPKKRPKPKMPDQIEKGVEKEILGYVEEYPTYLSVREQPMSPRKITDGRIGYTGGGIHKGF
jgi:hypothetical protein